MQWVMGRLLMGKFTRLRIFWLYDMCGTFIHSSFCNFNTKNQKKKCVIFFWVTQNYLSGNSHEQSVRSTTSFSSEKPNSKPCIEYIYEIVEVWGIIMESRYQIYIFGVFCDVCMLTYTTGESWENVLKAPNCPIWQ